jgi:hypothetical protein
MGYGKARETADAAVSIQWLEAVPSHLLARLRRGEPNEGRDVCKDSR